MYAGPHGAGGEIPALPAELELHILDSREIRNHWTGKNPKSARREIFCYDETDLMALRVDGWKMHIGSKKEGSWWNEKTYTSIPYLFNLLMDPMEKMDQESHEWGTTSRRFFASKLWH